MPSRSACRDLDDARRRGATGLDLYDRTAQDAAAAVIAAYSTSFGLACRLLGPRVRPHVRNVYALVRVADEIVDGPAAAAGLDADTERRVLDDLEAETLAAIERGFSANLVVHAFARTARECGIGEDLVRPFFASMRTDLTTADHDAASHDAYVYGSAEVVGLMCLQVFVNAGASAPRQPGARARRGRPAPRRGLPGRELPARPRPRRGDARPRLPRRAGVARARCSTASTPTSPPRPPSSRAFPPTAAAP